MMIIYMSDSDSSDSECEYQNPVEGHEKIKDLICDWRMIGIISAYINRGMMDKSQLTTNVLIADKKPELIQNLGEPNILNVSCVDIYAINLFRHVHQSFERDLQYLRGDCVPPGGLKPPQPP